MVKGPLSTNPDHPNAERAVVKGPWVSKQTAYLTIAMGAAAMATGRHAVAQALIVGGIIMYMQNEQLLPWQ